MTNTHPDNSPTKNPQFRDELENKSVFGVIMHSFFIVPFLIAVFCVLLFLGVRMLTSEPQTAYDYLEDVKTGGVAKRWQAAFELSKLLADPDDIPDENRFIGEMSAAFKKSEHDDPRVRQYLAVAMARTGKKEFFEPLVENITDEQEDTLYAVVYALGLLNDPRAEAVLADFITHPEARIRSAAAASLGTLQTKNAQKILKNALSDKEPNVQWVSAISLAQMKDASGKDILQKLLDRQYLQNFSEVDPQEVNHLIIAAVNAAVNLNDPQLNRKIQHIAETDSNMKVRAAAKSAAAQIR